jgi:uncharacterized protein YdhG (YjbR/CyaY superfamily)
MLDGELRPQGGSDMSGSTTATAWIDANLAALPADQRAALQSLRETIAAAAPGAEETISYRMPAFRYHGRVLVWFAGFKTHCSFFPMSVEAIEAYGDELAPFASGRGTLRFTPEHQIPKELVERIVRQRMAQIDARRAVSPG